MTNNGGFSLVNLGDTAKPFEILVERSCDAVGGLFQPWQIRRVRKAEAEAEVEAALIRLRGQQELGSIERRAAARFVGEEIKKQENMESILASAAPQLNAEAQPERIETDWLHASFDRARLVSNEEMQSLWARVPAGEANSPGSFSPRTVQSLSTLARADAELFLLLMRFAPIMDGEFHPIVYWGDKDPGLYRNNELTFSKVQHLADIGLVTVAHHGSFSLELASDTEGEYFGRRFEAECGENPDIDIGLAMLTRVGQELAKVVNAEPVHGLLESAVRRWRSVGIDVTVWHPDGTIDAELTSSSKHRDGK